MTTLACMWSHQCCACLYSSRKSLALCPSRDGSCIVPPRVIALRCDQISHVCTRNISNSSNGSLFSSFSINCIKSFWPPTCFCNPLEHPAHTSYATLQSHKTWMTDSFALWILVLAVRLNLFFWHRIFSFKKSILI